MFAPTRVAKVKNETYIINFDNYSNVSTHWVTIYVKTNEVTYFDSFGAENIPKKDPRSYR